MKKGLGLIVAIMVILLFTFSDKAEAWTGSGTIDNPYVIWDVNDLQNIESDLTAYYELGGDIDASATSGWNGGAGFLPVGQAANFTGQLDGKEYSITDLFIDRQSTSYIGLFRKMEGTVQNLTITGTILALSSAGGIAGQAEAAATISNCHSSTDVSGRVNVGGLVGRLLGAVSESSASGTIQGYEGIDQKDTFGGLIGETYLYANIEKSYATGNVNGRNNLGGFTGNAYGSVSNCYATGDVTGTNHYIGGFCGIAAAGTVDNCYSTGIPTGDSGVGGFCGLNSGGNPATISDCFWDTETSNTETSNGGTGLTTLEMFDDDVFLTAGWDGVNIWELGGGDYPRLSAGEPIPEPTSLLLLGFGVLGVGLFRKNLANFK